MCSNYRPVTRMDRLLTFFGVERDRDDVPVDVLPTGLAPVIRRAEPGSGNRVVMDGAFGLLPFFAKEVAYGRRTVCVRQSHFEREFARDKDAVHVAIGGRDDKKPRRRYSEAQKAQVLAECDEPGASVAKVAMAHGINARYGGRISAGI